MGKKRTAVHDVLDAADYRQLLDTAARLDDREKAITTFYLLIVLGRVGLRVGEALHMTDEWYSRERQVINIPPHVPCDCSLCEHYAEKADDATLDDYWRAKYGQGRTAYVYTEQQRDAIERYFEELPYTGMSYSTANRRVTLAAELTETVNAARTYPHALRATAATHLAWSDVLPVALDVQFGWQNPKTRRAYVDQTGLMARRQIDKALGREPDIPTMVRRNPPTFTELRDRDDAVEPDTWTPSTSVESHPRGRDPEEQLELGNFGTDADPRATATTMGATVMVVCSLLLSTVVASVML